MRIDLRSDDRRPVGRVELDPAARPTRVTVPEIDREVFLAWDSALDDAGHLRRCVACGCRGMFRTKSFPQVTLLVVVLAFAGAVVAALGYAANPIVLAALVALLCVDVGILLFSRPLLVCYRCRSTYSRLPIARYHRRWDRREAERWPSDPPSPELESTDPPQRAGAEE
ncbi:MAG TPA: hypothetical protein PKC43_08810 [Phycisphaerales bacterium]|nr:hypothetical protein [Phycisphaerales bacterium]HMP37536.1 hypothetical protein [Phycisphaerales bacterium]